VLLTDKWLNVLYQDCFGCICKDFGFVSFACRYEEAIYRMVRKGILKPRKIGRFLAFSKSDLEYVITNGEKKRTPGRPRKI